MGKVGESFSDNAALSLKEDVTMNSREGGHWGREAFLCRNNHYEFLSTHSAISVCALASLGNGNESSLPLGLSFHNWLLEKDGKRY